MTEQQPASAHPLGPEPDGAAASWMLDALVSWPPAYETLTVATFVPEHYPAAVKILHPWRRQGSDVAETRWEMVAHGVGLPSAVALADTRRGNEPPHAPGWVPPMPGQLDRGTASALVDVLGHATTTPEDVLVGVWTGWSGFPYDRFTGAATIPTEARGHVLLRGALAGVLEPVSDEPWSVDGALAGIWWPADRAWVVTTEVDFEWTIVAGGEELIARLAAHPALEVMHTWMDAPANRLDGDHPA